MFKDFVESRLLQHQSLRVILGNRFREQSAGPSWVPDILYDGFRGGVGLLPAPENETFQAAGRRPPIATVDHERGVLSAKGVRVGEADRVIGPMRIVTDGVDFTTEDLVSASTAIGQVQFFEDIKSFRPSLSSASDFEKMWRTLCLEGNCTDLGPFSPSPTDFARQFQVVLGEAEVPDDFMPGAVSNSRYSSFVTPYLLEVQAAMTDRTFFTIRDGGMGVGPYLARVGDIVVVLFGAMFCLVLRPVGKQFKLVGDAYVQGIMHGEMVQNLEGADAQTFEII